jgi:hypothetical protein
LAGGAATIGDVRVLYLGLIARSNDQVTAVCSLCGDFAEAAHRDDPPLGWSADIVETSEGHRTRWVCTDCTRRFVRSIEAKLDQQWW